MVTREARLARTFVEVTDTLVADFDIVDLHTLVADRCVEIFRVDAAGLMVASANAELRVMAASDGQTRGLELFALQAREGPSFDCFQSGEPFINQDLEAHRLTWPRFAPAAIELGFSTAHAFPMRLRDEVIGALNLFQVAGQLGQDDLGSAQALADIATIAILHHRASINSKTLNDQLDHALTSRVIIEQAKGMLAALHDLTMDEAFNRLRTYARRNNRRLADVARAVVDGSLSEIRIDPIPPVDR
ncbi:MAG: GAF and ANTAR domain-containing protein [Acidimicrobiales bacterium]